MRRKGHRFVALLMTAALLFGQSGLSVRADELPAETAVDAGQTTPQINSEEGPVQAEPVVPDTEAQPVPETTAETTAETGAEQPSEVSSEASIMTEKENTTEASTEGSDSALSQDQNGAGPASVQDQSEARSEYEDGTESVSEDDGIDEDGDGAQEEEAETESEELTDTFTGYLDGAEVKITLGENEKLPADAVLVLHKIVKSEEPDRWRKIRNTMHAYTDQGGRELTVAAYYEYYFLVKEEKVRPAGPVLLSFTYPEHKSLKLDASLQPEAGVFAVSDYVQPLIAPNLDDNLCVTGFVVTVQQIDVLALGGIQSADLEAQETAEDISSLKGAEKPGSVVSGAILVPCEKTPGDADRIHAADAGKELTVTAPDGTALTFAEAPVIAEDGSFAVDFGKADNIASFFSDDVTEVAFTVTVPVPAEAADYQIIGSSSSTEDTKTVTVKKDGDSYLVTPSYAAVTLIPVSFTGKTALPLSSVDADTNEPIEEPYASYSYALYENADYADPYNAAVISDGVLYFDRAIFAQSDTRTFLVRETFESYLYEPAEASDIPITLTRTEEETADPEDPKEVVTVSPESVIYKHAPRTIAFTVKATDKDDASAAAQPGAAFTITPPGGTGTTHKDTTVSYSVKVTALSEDVKEKLAAGEAVTVEVKETMPPTGYEALSAADAVKRVTVQPNQETKALQVTPAEVIFPHTKTVLTFTANAVDEDGKDIDDVSYTVSPEAASSDSAKNKKTFTIDLKNARIAGMEPGTDLSLSVTEIVPGKYELDPATSNPQTITLHRAANGVYSITGNKDLVFKHKKKPVIVNLTVTVRDLDGSKLDGSFAIKDSAGNFLIGSKGEELSRIYVPEDGLTLVLSSEQNPGLTEESVITVTQLEARDTYTIVDSADQQLSVAVNELNIADLAADFINHRYEAKETIRLTKRLYVGANSKQDGFGMIFSSNKETMFYVALFADEAKTRRVTGVYPVMLGAGSPYKTLTLTHLPAGSYWIGETDAQGNLVGTSSSNSGYRVSYSGAEDKKGKVTLSASGTKQHSVTVNNHYETLPNGYEYVAQVGVRKIVRTAESAVDTSFNGKVRIRVTYAGKSQTKTVQVKKGESDYQVFYVPLGKTGKARTVRVTELTEKKSTIPNTAILADGNAYTVSIDKPRMSIKPGSAAQRVTVTNTRVKEEDQKKADQAVLKLTKKVQYKKAPIRVNAVYYIGIFDDANLTKLRYKRALQFRNASEVTATLKINLYKLASKEVTFYFAETDRNGKPVTGGKAVGYDIEQNKKGITLNASNPEDELVITNSVIEGTKREKILLDPSSGFAGDRAALAEAQERENSGNDSAVTTTGDTSPLLQWSTALVGSMMVLILYPLLTAQRRRRRRR